MGLPLEEGSIDEDREVGAPGLPLVADSGLSGSVVLKLGGASSEKPGISDGFHGRDLTVGEVPRDGTGCCCLEVTEACCLEVTEAGCLEVVGVGCLEVTGACCLPLTGVGCLAVTGAGLGLEEILTEGADILGSLDGVDGRRVGVDALDVDLEAGKVGLLVGVEDLAVDLDGVEDLDGIVDLAAGTVALVAEVEGLVEETTGLVVEIVVLDGAAMVLEGSIVRVGVEGLDGFEAVFNVERPVGVAGRDPGPPDDEGLLVPPLEELNTGEEVDCLDTKLVLPAGSD